MAVAEPDGRTTARSRRRQSLFLLYTYLHCAPVRTRNFARERILYNIAYFLPAAAAVAGGRSVGRIYGDHRHPKGSLASVGHVYFSLSHSSLCGSYPSFPHHPPLQTSRRHADPSQTPRPHAHTRPRSYTHAYASPPSPSFWTRERALVIVFRFPPWSWPKYILRLVFFFFFLVVWF